MGDAVYTRDGERLAPRESAAGPWHPGLQHGGPVGGLLARAVEAAAEDDPELRPARLTLDLFRPAPMQPLEAGAEVLRRGRRLRLLQAWVRADGQETARATALLLRPTDVAGRAASPEAPPGPDGLESGGLLPAERRAQVHPGFHTSVEVRWARRPDHARPAFWLRMPMPLVEGEPLSGLQRTVALADLLAALVAGATWQRGQAVPFINADTSLHLLRPARGEWLGLELDSVSDQDGIGHATALLWDAHGHCGHATQSRLSQPDLRAR